MAAPLVAVAGILLAAFSLGLSLAQQPDLDNRAVVPQLARDEPVPTPTSTKPQPPPPGEGYCAPTPGSGVPSPPNSVIGFLTIAGAPAPAGTLITLTFDGLPGPSAFTAEPGGYRIDYAAGGQGHVPPCINQVGTEIGLRIGGVDIGSGVLVGDEAARPFLRFDVAVP